MEIFTKGNNMSLTWVYVMLLVLICSFILQLVPLLVYFEAVIILNAIVLIGSYFIFKHNVRMSVKANMFFMLGVVLVNGLTDLGYMPYDMYWIAYGALILWGGYNVMRKE